MFDNEEVEFYNNSDPKGLREALWERGVWIDKDGNRLPVAEMNEQRVKYILAFLERKAKAEYHSILSFYISTPEPNGEMAQDAFDQEFASCVESDWTDIFEDYAIVPYLRTRLAQFEKEKQNRQKEFTL